MTFKDIRRTYYQLGKGREVILMKMGYLEPEVIREHPLKTHDEKRLLMQIEEDGRVEELIQCIDRRKEELDEHAGKRSDREDRNMGDAGWKDAL